MKTKLAVLFTAIICCAQYVHAQTETSANAGSVKSSAQVNGYPRNNIQWNVSSLFFKNYNFSYERLIRKKISVVASYRFMPSTMLMNVPAGKKIFEKINNGENDNLDIQQTATSNHAVTAEVRFYSGRHPGARGFYFSLYGRYANFKTDYPYKYTDANGQDYSIPVNTNTNGIAGGVMVGAQWIIAKRVTFDWYILGAHYGSVNGTLNGTADLSALSKESQQEIQDDINNFIVVGSKQYINATVNDHGVTGTIKGPLVGVRAGISVGIAF